MKTRFSALKLIAALAAAAALALPSCNTVSGFGQDLQDASHAVQRR